MAKKSTATRQAPAARRSQTTAKQASVALVRTPRSDSSTTDTATSTSLAAPAAKPATTRTPHHEGTKAASKPTVVARSERPRPQEVGRANAKAGARPAPRSEGGGSKQQQQIARAQATRVARARATQRARAANAISPENYGYVIKDLKLIFGLACTMFAVMIALHFVLPS